MPDKSIGIDGQARIVAFARVAVAHLEAEYERYKLAFTAEHAKLIHALETSRMGLSHAESTLKRLALQHYAETKNKKPCNGVTVHTEVRATIVEPATVLAWCLHHCKPALQFDDKMVKAMARAARVVPGITTEIVPVAHISESLTSILEIDTEPSHETEDRADEGRS